MNERVGREPLEKREGAVKREWAGGTPFLLLLCSPVLGLGAASFARVSAQGGRVADPPREVRALGGAPFVAFTSKGCGFFTDLTLRRVARPPRDFSESGHPRLAPRELVSEVVSCHRELP